MQTAKDAVTQPPSLPQTLPEGARQQSLPGRYVPWAGLLFLCAFAFYIATLAPGLMPGDTGDMVIAAASLREAHPPGYPLYAMIGKLFVALPIGDIPYRANLMAAFLGGLSVALVFLALLLLTRRPLASLAGALLFAFNYLFWTYFTLAETFCLNNFTLALTAFLALLWRERHRQEPGGRASRRLLVLLAFVAGVSMGNHHTMVLTYPGLFLFVAVVDRSVLRPARLAALAGWFAFGLALVYAYLPIAALVHHDHHWEDSSTLSGLLRLFLRAKYGTFQLAPGDGKPVTPPEQAASYFGALATQYLWPGFVLALVGLAALWKRDRAALLHSGGGFLFGVLFILTANIDPRPTAYDAATLERFYQLPNFFFLLWTGAGLGVAERWLEGICADISSRAPIGKAIPAILLLALPAALLAVNYGKANLRGNLLYPRFMTNIFDSLPKNAVFFVWSDTVGMGADYLTDIEKRRPDVAVIKVGILGAEPYRSTVRRKYPHLRWPDLAPDAPFSMGRFIQHNIDRYRIFLDGLPMKLTFPVIRYGLIYEVRPQGSVPSAAEVLDLNEELWKRFDLRQVDTSLYPANSMCYSVVVFYYLYHRFTMASECNYFGRYDAALRHLEACSQMDPKGYVARSAPWQRQKAVAHIGLNQLDQAVTHLDLARKEDPSDAETYRLLSLAYQKKGDQAQADYYLDEYEIRRRAEEQEPRKEGQTP
ncbi:MAG TPA: DUF2723 domain-containing protein [Armatimonadota bacterium]|nr:DUF2723 domain-containing protein [Armatimonadota bacterium]